MRPPAVLGLASVGSSLSKGDPAWLGGSEPLGTMELIAFAIVLTPAIWIPANLGARYGASEAFTWAGACWRALAWSLACAWTFAICAGHGIGILPLPAWLAFVAGFPCFNFPSAWIPIVSAVLSYLGFALQHRGRSTGAPWS